MNLLETLDKNEMVIPDYTNYSIIDLIRTVYKYCGYYNKKHYIKNGMENYIHNKKHILFILCDGMGSNVINSLPNNMLLKKNKVKDLLTVCPTTTGCVLSSIATAEYPAIHGMIGWYNYNRAKNLDYYVLLFKDRKNKIDLNELNIKEKDIYVYDSVVNKLKRDVVTFFPQKNVDSKFSKFFCNSNRVGFKDIDEAFQKAIKNIEQNLDKETYSYIYLPYVDTVSHEYGVYSDEVKEVIYKIEKQISQLKEKNIQDLEIIITADHGQIDITKKGIVMDFNKYNDYFYALPGIDYGTVTYYIKQEKRKQFIEEFKKDYNEKMYIFDTEEFIKNNIFGNDKISNYMKSNLGEFISFCKKGDYFINNIESPDQYLGNIKGNHSGFSADELYIPLIVIDS